MNPTFSDFAPLYDFSQFEKAVQAFYVSTGVFSAPPDNSDAAREGWTPQDGTVPFFTGFQNLVFQANRPRVSLGTISYTPAPGRYLVVDANNRPQVRAWTLPLNLEIITKADYDFHMQYRSTVFAIATQMRPVLVNSLVSTTGLNPFLNYHDLGNLEESAGSLEIAQTADKGYYLSEIKFNATFSVRATVWPGGILNA